MNENDVKTLTQEEGQVMVTELVAGREGGAMIALILKNIIDGSVIIYAPRNIAGGMSLSPVNQGHRNVVGEVGMQEEV